MADSCISLFPDSGNLLYLLQALIAWLCVTASRGKKNKNGEAIDGFWIIEAENPEFKV